MMPIIESSILLKNHVNCSFMLKYYITVSLGQFTKTLNQFFDLSRANENLEIYIVVWLEAVNYYHKELHLRCCSSPRSASDLHLLNVLWC